MLKSKQRLGDDPRDYDGHFRPIKEEFVGVGHLKPDVDVHRDNIFCEENDRPKWNLYPKPPPPHWHWRKDQVVHNEDGSKALSGNQEFRFEDIAMPEVDSGWSFALDEKGVFQVYDNTVAEPGTYSAVWPKWSLIHLRASSTIM